jgi:hypothetical protein
MDGQEVVGRLKAHALLTSRNTPYDLTSAAERVRAGYPQTHDFADNYILKQPTEARMLEAFNQTAPT